MRPGMAQQSTKSVVIFLPIGMFAGLALGAAAGQPIIGVLVGTAGGTAAATWLWMKDRKPRRED
jgi:hypothetical protein